MKLTKYFMPLAAIALLASCSDDKGIQEPNNGLDSSNDPFYVSIKISQDLTRTQTPGQGSEKGTEEESKVTTCLLIFNEYKTSETTHPRNIAVAAQPSDIEYLGKEGSYAASFKMLREQLTAGSYRLYVIANPSEEILKDYLGDTSTDPAKVAKSGDIQSSFTLTNDGNKYWTANNFLMTTAKDPAYITISSEDLVAGAHSVKSDALNLGKVTVQRAMSRFDLAANNMEYSSAKNNNGTLGNQITIKFVSASLVNQANKANIFKVGGSAAGWSTWLTWNGTDSHTEWDLFLDETSDSYDGEYVYSPTGKTMLNPLFESGSQVDLKGLTYDAITAGKPDDNDYEKPTDPTYQTYPDFFVWRYAMENTIQPQQSGSSYNDNGQVKNITTAIVFRAQMTGGFFNTALTAGDQNSPVPVYAYGNTVIGPFDELQKYKVGAEDNDATAEIIAVRLQAAKDATSGWNDESSSEEDLQSALVAKNFTIYRPESVSSSGTDQGYFCYYVYYNRHNDNDNNASMGPMEFATVRNNVYKLYVKTLKTLGHPGTTTDDPTPEKPDDPDESQDFWCEMQVTVLPWEVRINEIEF